MDVLKCVLVVVLLSACFVTPGESGAFLDKVKQGFHSIKGHFHDKFCGHPHETSTVEANDVITDPGTTEDPNDHPDIDLRANFVREKRSDDGIYLPDSSEIPDTGRRQVFNGRTRCVDGWKKVGSKCRKVT